MLQNENLFLSKPFQNDLLLKRHANHFYSIKQGAENGKSKVAFLNLCPFMFNCVMANTNSSSSEQCAQ